VEEADENTIAWIDKVKKKGFKVCIVSNASESVWPDLTANLMLTSSTGLEAQKQVVCESYGDNEYQSFGNGCNRRSDFTDIYGGNKVNMFTILVTPIDKREYFFVRLKRIAEKFVLAKMKTRKQI